MTFRIKELEGLLKDSKQDRDAWHCKCIENRNQERRLEERIKELEERPKRPQLIYKGKITEEWHKLASERAQEITSLQEVISDLEKENAELKSRSSASYHSWHEYAMIVQQERNRLCKQKGELEESCRWRDEQIEELKSKIESHKKVLESLAGVMEKMMEGRDERRKHRKSSTN